MDLLLEKVINYLEILVKLNMPMGVEAMKDLLEEIDISRKCTIGFNFAPVKWDQFMDRPVDTVTTLNSYPIVMFDPKGKQDLGTLNCVSRFSYNSKNYKIAETLSVVDQVRFALNEWYTGLSATTLKDSKVLFRVPDKRFEEIINLLNGLAIEIVTGKRDWPAERGLENFMNYLHEWYPNFGFQLETTDLFQDSLIHMMTLVGFLQPIAEKLVITIG